jgi:hypothetical protein
LPDFSVGRRGRDLLEEKILLLKQFFPFLPQFTSIIVLVKDGIKIRKELGGTRGRGGD